MQHPESKSRTIKLGLEKRLLNEIEALQGLCWTLTQLVASAWLLPGWTLGVVESRSPVIYTCISVAGKTGNQDQQPNAGAAYERHVSTVKNHQVSVKWLLELRDVGINGPGLNQWLIK